MHCSVISKIYHVNEALCYTEFSKEFIKYNVGSCLSDLLRVFPTYLKVEFLWDVNLVNGKGCLLKKVIINDIIEEKINIQKKLSEINLKEELKLYMKRTLWNDTKK